MAILVGHPVGNPNSYEVAAAYFEAGMLDAFCIPWMPSSMTISLIGSVVGLQSLAQRLGRRSIANLSSAPKIQGRLGEVIRLATRHAVLSGEAYSERNNRWLMRTMSRACHRTSVRAIHAYEDCSLWSFREAKRLGKACVYDLPTCYFPAWERCADMLNGAYADWLPAKNQAVIETKMRERKRAELELADLTLVASRYVEQTVRECHPQKSVVLAHYGVDTNFWKPLDSPASDRPMQFVYAGQISVRKGLPLLIEAWSKAGAKDARLLLVGSWALNQKKRNLPLNVIWVPPCSPQELRAIYQASDVFIFPSYSDGFGLVLLEAMACAMPVIASAASAAPEIVTSATGRIFTPGNLEHLVELIRWSSNHRPTCSAMGCAARSRAAEFTWNAYREQVRAAVAKLI